MRDAKTMPPPPADEQMATLHRLAQEARDRAARDIRLAQELDMCAERLCPKRRVG